MTNYIIPADLNFTGTPDPSDKNYYDVKVTGLQLGLAYGVQFQWVFANGSLGLWSASKNLVTNVEQVFAAPTNTITGGAGIITVSLPSFPENAQRVDVRIAGGVFGDGTKVADSFTAAGTKTIAAPGSASPGLAYIVSLLTVSKSNINGSASSPTTVYVTDPAASIAVDPSVTPSTPTVSSVVGAIQLSWNGKTSTGDNQPAGFDAAKVYVGTSADFTPVDSGSTGANQVDVLNFANGQNTLNIGVGTIVNGVALTYDTDYYIKIKTTNGNVAQDSSAVSATGNPAQIGKVSSSGIVSVTADKILTGTLQSNSTITVGSPSGKRVELRGTGNPFEIFGTGGTSLLSYNTDSNKLTITGDGTFSGQLSAASGTFNGNITASNGLFSVNNGILTAQSGTIGGWAISGSVLESSSTLTTKISLNPATPRISLINSGSVGITIDPVDGIKSTNGNFWLNMSGALSLKGSFTLDGSATDTNKWNSSSFRAGSGSTYIEALQSGIVTLFASASSENEYDPDSGSSGTVSTVSIPSQIKITSTAVEISGLPGVGNGLTAIGALEIGGNGSPSDDITYYNSSLTNGSLTTGYKTSVAAAIATANYGRAARYRMIVADPYDYNKLKRGFGVYYGTRSSTPSASTGLVGDIWISW